MHHWWYSKVHTNVVHAWEASQIYEDIEIVVQDVILRGWDLRYNSMNMPDKIQGSAWLAAVPSNGGIPLCVI